MIDDKMTIEETSRDRCYSTKLISGLTPAEVDYVISAGESALQEVMENHGAGNTFIIWKRGYGIFSIGHFGGHLIVTTGSSCD